MTAISLCSGFRTQSYKLILQRRKEAVYDKILQRCRQRDCGGTDSASCFRTRSHKLRHLAITIFLDNSGGNVLEAQGLSCHKDTFTLSKYDDNRNDRGDQAGKMLEKLMKPLYLLFNLIVFVLCSVVPFLLLLLGFLLLWWSMTEFLGPMTNRRSYKSSPELFHKRRSKAVALLASGASCCVIALGGPFLVRFIYTCLH